MHLVATLRSQKISGSISSENKTFVRAGLSKGINQKFYVEKNIIPHNTVILKHIKLEYYILVDNKGK